MNFLEQIEKFLVRYASAVLSFIATLLGVTLSYDFTDLKARHVEWVGAFRIVEHPSVYWIFLLSLGLLLGVNIF